MAEMGLRLWWPLGRDERFLALSLVMDWLPDESVVTFTADAVNLFGAGDSYRLVQRMSLRQKMILLPMIAEALLDEFPDQLRDPAGGDSHLTHVAHYLPCSLQARCHVTCGCWRDISAQRARQRARRG